MTRCIRIYRNTYYNGEYDELAKSASNTWFIRRTYQSIYLAKHAIREFTQELILKILNEIKE